MNASRLAGPVVGLLLLAASGSGRADDPPVADLVRQLGDRSFATREKAQKALIARGEAARPAVEEAARSATDQEVRRRAGEVLRELDRLAAEKRLEEARAARKLDRPPPFDASAVKPLVDRKGDLTRDETWNPMQSYRITGPLTVKSGTRLTIDAGTVVLVAGAFDISVEKGATLLARTQGGDSPIVITALAERDGKEGSWGRLVIHGTATLDNVQVRRSRGVVAEPGSSPALNDVGIYHTDGDALTFRRCYGQQGEVTVRKATGNGIVAESSYPRFRKADVSDCTVGVYCSNGCYPRFEEATVHTCQVGVHVIGGAYPRFTALTAALCRAQGVVIQNGSYPYINELALEDIAGVGLLLQGNSYPQIGPIRASNCARGDRQIEAGSRIRPRVNE